MSTVLWNGSLRKPVTRQTCKNKLKFSKKGQIQKFTICKQETICSKPEFSKHPAKRAKQRSANPKYSTNPRKQKGREEASLLRAGEGKISGTVAVWICCDTMLCMHVQGTGRSLVHGACNGRVVWCQ